MTYIQQTAFSNSPLGRDLVVVLGAVGYSHVKTAFESIKHKDELEGIFKKFLNSNFVQIEKNSNSKTDIPYQSVDKALKELHLFTEEDRTFGRDERKRKKLEILLDSVTFQESECLFRIVTKNYDTESFRLYLFPQTSKKKNREETEVKE